jgi:hypothetical protein
MAYFSLKSYQISYLINKKPCNRFENRALKLLIVIPKGAYRSIVEELIGRELKDNPQRIGKSKWERLFVENVDKKYLEAALILLKAVSEHSHGVAKKSIYSNNREFFESVNKLLSKTDKKSDS